MVPPVDVATVETAQAEAIGSPCADGRKRVAALLEVILPA